MSKISRKIQADKGMTEGVSHLKTADWSKWFVWKFVYSLTSYSVQVFDFFGRVFDNDTKPMRKCRVPGHIRAIKHDEIKRGQNVKPV